MSSTRWNRLLCILTVTAACGSTADRLPCQSFAAGKPRFVYASTTKAVDSRGEPLYESQTVLPPGVTALPGNLLMPTARKTPDPKYPKSLKKAKAETDVTVSGVAACNGDFIDIVIPAETPPDVAEATFAAVSRYKLSPATLDGKPIALQMQIMVSYRIR